MSSTAPSQRTKSLSLSLRNIWETLAISFPTLVDATRGRITKQLCDDRLEGWATRVVHNAGMVIETVGRENLHGVLGSTFLVMSNHQSLYDIPAVFYVIGSNIRMITKKELFHVPIFGKALELGGFISIDRSNRERAIESLEVAKRLLASGTHVWIAPEGTRSRDGKLLPFKKGGFNLALESGLPILPVTLNGTRDALRAKGLRSVPDVHVHVTLHRPIDPRPYATEGKAGRDRLIEDVRAAIASGLD